MPDRAGNALAQKETKGSPCDQMHLDMRIGCCYLSRCFDAGWSSATDHDVTVFCLYRWECFAQRFCGQGTARRECVGVLRHSRHGLAVSHTPQSIDKIIILYI